MKKDKNIVILSVIFQLWRETQAFRCKSLDEVTQAELARAINVSRSLLCNIEKNAVRFQFTSERIRLKNLEFFLNIGRVSTRNVIPPSNNYTIGLEGGKSTIRGKDFTHTTCKTG